MIQVLCDRCRLVWQEAPAPDGEPLGPWALQCPRCSHLGAADATVLDDGEHPGTG